MKKNNIEDDFNLDDEIENEIENTYNADSIKGLSERDKIRTKTPVYAGDTVETGFHVLLREPVDNSIDEFNFLKDFNEKQGKNTSFDTIKIFINSEKNIASVRDYGRGIPYEKDKNGLSTLEKTVSILHAGGKHENNSNHLLSQDLNSNKSNYQFSSGINGIGITLTNYASNFFAAVVYNEKKKEKAYIVYKNGYLDKETTIVDINTPLDFLTEEQNQDNRNGTLIIYEPSVKDDDFDDENVFEAGTKFNKEMIFSQLKILPYLNIGLRVELNFDGEHIIFEKEEKFVDILKKENKKIVSVKGEDGNYIKKEVDLKLIMEESPYFTEYMILGQNRESDSKNKKVFSLEEWIKLDYEERKKYKIKTTIFELGFNFIESNDIPFQENTVNGSIRIKGGKQDTVWKTQIKNTINSYIEENHKKIGSFETEDIINSLTFMFMVKINEPLFAGQTKEKLNNPELQQFGNYFFKKYLTYWINREDKKNLARLIMLLEANRKARLKSNEIKESVFKELNNKSDDALLLNKGKLSECTYRGKDPEKLKLLELMLIEGDSAAGPAKSAAVREYVSILPLKGKVLNAIKNSPEKIFKNDEIINLNTALECGIGKDFDITKLKYPTISIFTDADIDGLHIASLLIALFYKYYKPLISNGNIYINLAPLYQIVCGKNIKYAWNEKEKNDIVNKANGKCTVQRYKGLGEMNNDELYEATLKKGARRMVQIQLNDLIENEKEIMTFMNDRNEDKEYLKVIFDKYYQTNNKPIIKLTAPKN